MISAKQMRAARALLGWSQQEMADKALVSRSSIARLEAEDLRFDHNAGTAELVRRALEDAGISFLYEDGGGGEGVRLRRKASRIGREQT